MVNSILLAGLTGGLARRILAPPPAAPIVGVPVPAPTAARPAPTVTAPPITRDDLLRPRTHFGLSAPEVAVVERRDRTDRRRRRPPTDRVAVLSQVDRGVPRLGHHHVLPARRGAGALVGAVVRPAQRRRPAHIRPAKIARGDFDGYITRVATAIRDQEWPLAIRFAHEMNGNWYPWSEQTSGNRPGDYVRAWRHVHDIFRRVGATNVVWIWSPNIVRPVPGIDLRRLYPGDAYVDWIGLVGYAVTERTAAAVFDPSLAVLARFTDKPVIITETGVQPSDFKSAWITDFFRWLPTRRQVIGFIWFEYNKEGRDRGLALQPRPGDPGRLPCRRPASTTLSAPDPGVRAVVTTMRRRGRRRGRDARGAAGPRCSPPCWPSCWRSCFAVLPARRRRPTAARRAPWRPLVAGWPRATPNTVLVDLSRGLGRFPVRAGPAALGDPARHGGTARPTDDTNLYRLAPHGPDPGLAQSSPTRTRSPRAPRALRPLVHLPRHLHPRPVRRALVVNWLEAATTRW